MRLLGDLNIILLNQRGHLFGWVPVGLGLGISLYFGLRYEPVELDYLIAVVVAVGALGATVWLPLVLRPFGILVGLVAIGFLAAGFQAHRVAGPVLGYRYYGPIQGRIIEIDRSASDAVRVTLDQVVLADMSPQRTPARVRVALYGDQSFLEPMVGMEVILTGHLSPPSGPVEPGGYDFQRNAWFDRLGAVGYTRTSMLLSGAEPDRWQLWIGKVRQALSMAVQRGIEGEAGGFAAALTTGDRSAMSLDTVKDLRGANLAHLIAISGLHMGLLSGFVFALVRVALALTPFALRHNSKKVAAVFALVAASAYLLLSGSAVATQRSYIMVMVMLAAVLLDRQALTLRSVAMAATIILLLEPAELTGPGFQMSFAATTALVAVFAWQKTRAVTSRPGWLRYLGMLLLSSFVAGAATAPFAAAHFNQVSHFGLIANLLSVPVMGAVVMPAAVVAACLAPLGLEWIAFAVMEAGLNWILWVAHWITGFDGAVGHVVEPRRWTLGALTLGALLVILWQGRLRLLGAIPMVVALAAWPSSPRPVLLVSESGGLMGLMTDQGRALTKSTGDGFSADSWLENDGAAIDRLAAAARPGFARDGRLVWADIGGQMVLLVTGKTALAALDGCGGAVVLIANQPNEAVRPCDVYDLRRLARTGALSIALDEQGGLIIKTARDVAGQRLWNSRVPAMQQNFE